MNNVRHLLSEIQDLHRQARRLTRYAPSWRHKEVDEINQRRLLGMASELEAAYSNGARDVLNSTFKRISAEHQELATARHQAAYCRWQVEDLKRKLEAPAGQPK